MTPMFSTVTWLVGLALVVASFGFLLSKPRTNSRPVITIDDD
jgi:hypothetical protein